MSEETKKTPQAEEPAVEPNTAEQAAPETAPEQAAAPETNAEAADPKKKDGFFNKKAREMEAVKAKLDAAEKNAAQAKDQLLRMAAEYDNYRKAHRRRKRKTFTLMRRSTRSRRCWAFTITSSAALPSMATRSRPTARALKWCSTSSKRASKSWVLKRWTPPESPLTPKSTTP